MIRCEQTMLATTKDSQIEYPESDGRPMGETDLHRDWMVRILELLRFRYRGQRVYMASDLLVYYQEGDPTQFIVPDDFVVLDCEPGRRRTFKTWAEGKCPNVVFEVTSRGTRQNDEIWKPPIFAKLGIQEYFLYDPTSDYLNPPLQGFRLVDGGYVRIESDAGGAIACEQLGILLRLDGSDLVMVDARTGQLLLTAEEAAIADAHAQAEKAQEEAEARRAAEAAAAAAQTRAAELEAELKRLREVLGRDADHRPSGT
jgi:Uma2 family endonuclease